MSTFSDIFTSHLDSRGWNQVRAAAEIGLTQSQVSNFKSGKSKPSFENLVKISTALKVSVESLSGETTHSVKMVGEAEFSADPWPAWVRNLRGRYQAADEATQAVMAADIRRLWPRPVAEKILAWLRTDPEP